MRIGCSEACACITFCCKTFKHGLAATVIQLNEVMRDPEAFQKICIVSRSVLQGINFASRADYFPEIIKILNVTESFDFYGFCRLPRYFLFPYVADRLNEQDILNQLEEILCNNWHKGIPDERGHNHDPAVRQFAKNNLKEFLEILAENDHDFHSEEELKTVLYHWLTQKLGANPQAGFNPHDIDLQDLTILLNQSTWLEVLIDTTFIIIDIACIPAFLQDWSLIDLSFFSRQLGKVTFLAWIPLHSLDEWIWRAMLGGYFLQFIEGFFNLFHEDSRDVKLQTVAAAAECLYCYAILQKKDPKIIALLAFFAKGLGLLRFMLTPKQSFFDRPF